MSIKYKDIMELPSLTQNTRVFDLLKDTVTEEDVKGGTDIISFATANLIEWAIKNKKFVEYYTHMTHFKSDQERWDEEARLTKDKEIILTFNFASEPKFGLYSTDDGDSVLAFPGKDGMYFKYL